MNDYPNRDALRKANDIYLDVMRSFIFRCLDLIPGETAESIIKTHIGHDSDYPIKDAIDFDDIPFLFRTYWNNSFELHFNRVDPYYEARSAVQLIVEGRNRSSHPPWDLDLEFTRTHLFIIAELLGKVNRLDKQDEVEAIRDELLFDDAAKQISALSEKYDAEKAEKKKYKNELTETKQRLVELKNEQTSYKERIEALTDVEKEKKDVEERLATISKEHKEVEEAWSECDECLTTTRNQLKEEKNANNSLKERLESIEKQFKEVEKEKKNHKDSLASIKKQLAAAKSEKMDTERHLASMRNLLTTVAIDNQIFPPLSTDSAVRILDRRNTDKKNYLLNLLELKQPSIIYVQGEQKINQFLTHVAPEKAEVIGIHNEHTSDAEEKVLLEKLENGDLIAIVSNAIFSTLPQLHCVEHFVFCHHVLGVEGFFKRCHPAFTSSQNTYLHLIYNHKQDFQEFEDLVQKYPDRHTLEKLYTELKDHIEVSENFVKPEKYYNEVGVVKQEFETSFAIFAELRLLERNEEGIKLLHPSGKKLEESKIYCIGEKLKKEIEHFDNSQLTQSIEQIWDNILVNVNVDINKFTHEQDNNIFEVKDNSQTTTGYVTDNSNPSNAYMWPQRTISSFNILRKYAAINISESNTLLREENKNYYSDRPELGSPHNEKFEIDISIPEQDYKNKYNLAIQFAEDHGISALKQGIAELIQDKDNPEYDFTEDETKMLQAFQDALKDFQKQSGESDQAGSNNEKEIIEKTIDSENTEKVDTIKRSRAKVTEKQVKDIRKRSAAGESYNNLSKEFGITTTAIRNIVKRNTWKDVE
jgi:Mor family transcriptional regulator